MPDLVLKAYHTPALCLSPVRADRARIKEPAFVEVWMHRKSEGIKSAVLVGTTAPGQSLTFDYNPTQKEDLVFYAVPKDAVGRENVSRLADAIKKTFSFAGSITAEDSSFDITTEKNFYPVDCSSGNLTGNLPSAVTCIDWEVTFKKMDSSANTLTIEPIDGEYIDNAIGMKLENQYDSIKLRSNGKDWVIVLDYGNPAVRVEPEVLPLDSLSVTAAYGLRKLSSSYSGYCIKVRRASDNAEQDIGFSGNDLDTAALASFCSGTNGFIKTWYDQSGNSKNASVSSTGRQPQIVSSGTVLVDANGNPYADFDGTDDILPLVDTALGLTQAFSVMVVALRDVTTNEQIIFNCSNGSCYLGANPSGGNWYAYAGATVNLGVSTSAAHCVQVVYNGASSKYKIDDGTVTTCNLSTQNATDNIRIGSGYGAGASDVYAWNGKIQEFIISDAAFSDAEMDALGSDVVGYFQL